MEAQQSTAGRRAFVTGGTGFVGSHLAEELLRRGYREVRCLVRNAPKWLEGLRVVPVPGDLDDRVALAEAVRDVDAVYHVAGLTRAPDRAAFERANVEGTVNLLAAVREAAPNVQRVLVTSSLAAVGRCAGGLATEASPLQPISEYGRSKARMELALEASGSHGGSWWDALPLTVVRPPAVYGPREADIFTFFQTVSRGLCPILGDGRTPDLSLVHVRDLVRGMVDAAEHPAAEGQTLFIGSDRAYSWHEVREATTMALGRRALTVRIPPALATPIGAVAEWGGRLTGTYPALNREKAREIQEGCKICSVAKARALISYQQEVGLTEGVRETIAWYRAEGWL